MFSCEFYEISKNTFFYRTPPVAASVLYCLVDFEKKIVGHIQKNVQKQVSLFDEII